MSSSPQPRTGAQILRFDQSEALLRKVMESAAVGMTLVGLDARMIYANRAYEAMLGFPPDGCLGLSAEAMIYEDDRQLALLRLAQLVRGETEEFRIECRLQHQDGSPIWALCSGSLLHSDTTGQPLYVIVQCINIERQKRAEAALAQSESRWNFALEAAGQGVWDHDIPNDGMFYSRVWRSMRGVGEDEQIDPAMEAWLARVHPDDVPRILANVKKQDAGVEGHDTLEYRERHRDGHYIWIQSRGRPVEWDANGNATRTIGTDTDITRRKEVEAQLAAEKELLHVTLQSIGDAVVSTDARGCISFMNPVAEKLTGWRSADAMGHPIAEVFSVVSEGTGLPVASPVTECLSRGELTYSVEDEVLLARDGSRRDVRSSAAPLHMPDGALMGAVLVFQDVTASRALQRQLTHSATHDPLTGLANRRAFEGALSAVTAAAKSEHRRHALCFVDLDHFKSVNDTAGHAAGDRLLREVAQVIRDSCRPEDFVARLGGDEFALLLCDCPPEAALRIATTITGAIAALDFTAGNRRLAIGVSVGIAVINEHSADPTELMSEADAACYEAKRTGRSRVVLSGAEAAAPVDA